MRRRRQRRGTDATDRATCRRADSDPLQLLRYRTEAERSAMRTALTLLDCAGGTRVLEGRPLVLTAAANLDVRAISDDAVSIADLDRRNAATERLAAQLGFATQPLTYRCGA